MGKFKDELAWLEGELAKAREQHPDVVIDAGTTGERTTPDNRVGYWMTRIENLKKARATNDNATS